MVKIVGDFRCQRCDKWFVRLEMVEPCQGCGRKVCKACRASIDVYDPYGWVCIDCFEDSDVRYE